MADVQKKEPAAKRAAEIKADKNADAVYPLMTLKANSMRLFGVTQSTFCGAFRGSDPSECFSIPNAKEQLTK